MINEIYKKPTIAEVHVVVEKANKKREKFGISIVELSKKLEVNYSNLTRVLNGGLINYQIVNKLYKWINE